MSRESQRPTQRVSRPRPRPLRSRLWPTGLSIFAPTKPAVFIVLLSAASAGAADLPRSGLVDLSVQSRVGFDSNPVASGGTSAALLGGRDTLTYAAGASVAFAFAPASSDQTSLRLAYTGEVVRFDRWAAENHTTHRLGLGGQFALGIWKFSGDASSLRVNGSTEPLLSIATVNANAIALWRERRRQWQHRAKLQTQARFGDWLVR
ncbi:MAG: hypothetical protein NTV51_02090, partial [Verrucomicrobia bacterium]|nr:hypothetical protein [Verrucomicrobiota bacterium]